MPGQLSEMSVNVRIAGRYHPPLSEMVTSYESIYGGNAPANKSSTNVQKSSTFVGYKRPIWCTNARFGVQTPGFRWHVSGRSRALL